MEFTEKSGIVFHSMTICSGGMPRTTHGDRFTVTVIKEDEDHVTHTGWNISDTKEVVDEDDEKSTTSFLSSNLDDCIWLGEDFY